MSIKDRLVGLLAYTDQLAKLTQKANFTTKAYSLLLYTEQQLRNRVGIHHDVTDDDGLAWLKIERLQRRDPPTPASEIADWIELHRDPTKKPNVNESILRTMPRADAEQLVDSGEIAQVDLMDSSNGDPETVDVRVLLKNQPDVGENIEIYLAGPWAEWKTEELPKIQTIHVYEKFFNLCQTMENSGAENPLEAVWGLGFALWKKGRKTLQHPLIEALVEVRIDRQSQAILITPRDREPQFYLSPFTELGIETVRVTQEQMRVRLDAILAVDEKTGIAKVDEFSPFNRASFESVLETAAGSLTGDGRYWPNVNREPENRQHPKVTETLTVTDTWAIYARRRGSNILVEDINRLRKEVEQKEEVELPPVGNAIVQDPHDEKRVRKSGGTDGAPNNSRSNANPLDDDAEILFPKPSNDAQLKIVKGLQREDGIVVQGPPGTGKTHTIANIICHYLATGRSVLVVSKGEPALAVLRDQIPEGIRDLTISLLTSEREGLKQLEGSVMFMMNDVLSKSPDFLNREIRDNKERAEQLKRDLRSIDKRMRELAEAQLTQIPASLRGDDKNWPFDAAQSLATDRVKHAWLDDAIGFSDRSEPQFDQSDIASLSEARRMLGKDLTYAGTTIPNRQDLPSSRDVASAHASLVQAASLRTASTSGSLPPILGQDEPTRASGKRLVGELKRMQQSLLHTAEEAWVEKLYCRWIADGVSIDDESSVEAAITELEKLGETRKTFRKRPIALPLQNVSTKKLKLALQRGSETGKAFGFVSLGAKDIKHYLQELTIAGQLPDGAADWSYVFDYVQFREKMVQFAYRWNALADDFDVPEIPVDAIELELWIGRQQKPLSIVLTAAISYHETVAADVQNLFVSGVDRKSLPFDSEKIAEMIEAVDAFLHRQELSESRFLLEKAQRDLHGRTGEVFDACRAILKIEVGNGNRDPQWIEERWAVLLTEFDRLGALRNQFSAVNRVAEKIASSGAPRWASRLLSVPAEADSDPLSPKDWANAWRSRRLEAFLKKIDARDELKAMSSKRINTQQALERATRELVKTRTYLGLHQRMSVGGRMSSLQQFVSAIRKIGQGTGVSANRHRGDAQKAMQKSMEAVPCWIMPTWRVSESLPATLGSFDLVIIDEASQSDIMALPALLRGRKVLVVGDDRQVSPSTVGLEERKLLQLRHGYLKGQPFQDLLMPGTSFYELAQAIFPSGRTLLNEHFRCVEPIIRFSLQFYPEKFTPLRIPKPSERLDPPLIDVYIKNATRNGMVNEAEVSAIVDEIERLVENPDYDTRSIGVVCLVGNKQASVIQKRLLQRIGEEKFLKHNIQCGDPPTFQGKERDIIFLSMVAVPGNATAQTARQFEQRYNVALSRARDRMYLYRSVAETDLPNERDLKGKVISHFKEPMPAALEHMKELIDLCDSDFEKDVFRRLAELNYRVTPQVAVGEYRIDLVVDGGDDRRLAIELDGDRYHGPDRWFEDYARQKTLERMNWQFWRCWGSSFALDPEGCMADLVDTLQERGIQPIGQSTGLSPFTEHRVLDATDLLGSSEPKQRESDQDGENQDESATMESDPVGVGDAVTILFDDEPNRVYQLTMIEGESELVDGLVSFTSTLGQQLANANIYEEIKVDWSGRSRICTIQSIQNAEVTST
ncbi:AAA domain-containing protein [Allorhodopirellula solitaria]|uniref:RecBCD enzyme subunit RecD n=1 Tax=Allorhodopirellula solitaria TaxID=2527987 RepID=A0A5C5X8A6_9BACT|nr:AAA domain-containing protein [Allorhodopirellula solitaria]TWT59160.1 RecBCD enzyme subunit RecD [Allorhodopirellula solitaria]